MSSTHFAYIALCADGTFYSGYTTDIARREKEHNGKMGAKYTAARRPIQIVYYECFDTKSEAMKREYALKKLSRIGKAALIAKNKPHSL